MMIVSSKVGGLVPPPPSGSRLPLKATEENPGDLLKKRPRFGSEAGA
jgi:hypothetical protein